MDWKHTEAHAIFNQRNAWTKGAPLSSISLYFYSKTCLNACSVRLQAWIFVHTDFTKLKCNILFCKYHSLREFVKNVVPRYMEMKIILRWFEKNVLVVYQMWIIQYYYSLHVDLTDSLLVLMCFCSLFSATFRPRSSLSSTVFVVIYVMSIKSRVVKAWKFPCQSVYVRDKYKHKTLCQLSERKYYSM